MQTGASGAAERLVRLGWLFPVCYAVHILEEWRGGEGFPAWFSRVTGARLMSDEYFLAWNVGALAGMAVGVVLAARFRNMRWLVVGFGASVLINGFAHLAASAATRSYSPGALSGALLWLPLGFLTVSAGRNGLSRRSFVAGVASGVLMHTVVVMLAYFGR